MVGQKQGDFAILEPGCQCPTSKRIFFYWGRQVDRHSDIHGSQLR